MLKDYTSETITTALDSQNGIALAYGKGRAMYGLHVQCGDISRISSLTIG